MVWMILRVSKRLAFFEEACDLFNLSLWNFTYVAEERSNIFGKIQELEQIAKKDRAVIQLLKELVEEYEPVTDLADLGMPLFPQITTRMARPIRPSWAKPAMNGSWCFRREVTRRCIWRFRLNEIFSWQNIYCLRPALTPKKPPIRMRISGNHA